MTKDLLQKELLEKVKPGMKPSDIKKKKPIRPKVSDEGYESDKSNKSIPTAPPLPNQTQNLQAQINSLQKQLEVYKSFKAADLKIKEGYKETINKLQEERQSLRLALHSKDNENKLLKEKIANLQKAKSPGEPQLTEKKKEPKLYLFTCSICDQNKKSPLHLAKVNGLGIDPTKLQKICDYCIKKVDLIQPPKENFF